MVLVELEVVEEEVDRLDGVGADTLAQVDCYDYNLGKQRQLAVIVCTKVSMLLAFCTLIVAMRASTTLVVAVNSAVSYIVDETRAYHTRVPNWNKHRIGQVGEGWGNRKGEVVI